MAIRKIARMGHPVLKEIAREIEDPTDPEVARLARDLIDTCTDIGGNGIAANQVYETVRMFVYRVRPEMIPADAPMAPIPWTVMINPVVTPVGEARKRYWERCLSLPGLYGQVPRPVCVRVEASDLEGTRTRFIAHGFQARVIQHEADHLDGVLYPMRMDDLSTLGYVSELGPPVIPALPTDLEDFRDPEPLGVGPG